MMNGGVEEVEARKHTMRGLRKIAKEIMSHPRFLEIEEVTKTTFSEGEVPIDIVLSDSRTDITE